MAKPKEQLEEDKALRDAAMGLFKTDVDFLKEDLKGEKIGRRILSRFKDGSAQLAEDTLDYTRRNPLTALAGVAVATALVFNRPLLDLAHKLVLGQDEDDEEFEEEENSDAEPQVPATALETSDESSGDDR